MFCPRCLVRYGDDFRFCPFDGHPLAGTLRFELATARATPQVGRVIGGRYDVRGLIGRGAMAEVLLAEDLTRHSPVAVKVLAPRFAKDAEARARFLREARASAALGHPNIVRVLDASPEGEASPYIVMEYLFGESFGERLRREPTPPIEVVLQIGVRAASALAAAHAASIVHRDVKPDNILLVGPPGAPYEVKLLDFGLAKLFDGPGATRAGMVVGTPEYMAPEQVVADVPDPRTDVYGLGMVLYRAVTGAVAFGGPPDATLLARQLIEAAERPSLRRAGIPAGLERCLLASLRKHPGNRYPSVDAFALDLTRLLDDPAADVTPPPLVFPEVFAPSHRVARQAARFYYRRLGVTPPASWPDP